ncbi:MAG: hypothetical protein ACHQ1G_01900 [Planctomycetota bacterium]
MSRALLLVALLGGTALAAPEAPSHPVTEDIRDIRGPVEIPARTPWALCALATLALAAAAAVLWRKRAKSLSAHERAVASLAAARALMYPALAREYATAVSEAVRRYIEERFRIPAGRRTTPEFLEAVAGDPPALLRDHLAPLKELLDFSDRAKFGGFVLAPVQIEGMYACACTFVETTRAAEGRRPS